VATIRANPQRPGKYDTEQLIEAVSDAWAVEQDLGVWFKVGKGLRLLPTCEVPNGVEVWHRIPFSNSLFVMVEKVEQILMMHNFKSIGEVTCKQ